MRDDPLSIENIPAAGDGGLEIVRLHGPVTLQNVFGFQEELRKDTVAAGTILDLTDVPYIDSAGMGAIIGFYVSCKNRGHKLVVAAPNYRVIELFRMTRVDTLIEIAPSLADALRV